MEAIAFEQGVDDEAEDEAVVGQVEQADEPSHLPEPLQPALPLFFEPSYASTPSGYGSQHQIFDHSHGNTVYTQQNIFPHFPQQQQSSHKRNWGQRESAYSTQYLPAGKDGAPWMAPVLENLNSVWKNHVINE